jgi:hypothetical protein
MTRGHQEFLYFKWSSVALGKHAMAYFDSNGGWPPFRQRRLCSMWNISRKIRQTVCRGSIRRSARTESQSGLEALKGSKRERRSRHCIVKSCLTTGRRFVATENLSTYDDHLLTRPAKISTAEERLYQENEQPTESVKQLVALSRRTFFLLRSRAVPRTTSAAPSSAAILRRSK